MLKFKGQGLSLRSIDGERIIFIHSKDLYAAVSYTKFTKFTDSPENFATHENIIRAVAEKTPAVPFGFNTIVGETIGKGVLFKNYSNLVRAIHAIGGKEEFIVYVHRDVTKKLQKFSSIAGMTRDREPDQRKKETRAYNKMYDIAGHKRAAAIHRNFADIAFESRYERLKSDERLLEGYYLVESSKTGLFNQTYNWVQSLYPELHFFIQGPQPPYSFNPVRITSANTRLFGSKQT
ncbi:GvpL/GvpF family gas vesicle protein [candidate division KSB1 bacterium]